MKNERASLICFAVCFVLSAVFFILDYYFWAAAFSVLGTCALLLSLNLFWKSKISDAAKISELEDALTSERQAHQDEIQKITEAERDTQEKFRSVLSHQLRMPLSIIQGYADLLVRDLACDEETRKEFLSKISERSNYVCGVLSAQLSASRITEDIIPIFSKVDIVAFIRQIGEDMQSLALRHGIHIETVSSLDSLIIDADLIQLNKIFYNILENAVKYMGREGQVTMCISSDPDTAFITVADNGMGLPPEETAHIFEYSYQGSNKVGGNGYGLFLVKKAVEAHGGTITASSTSGAGLSIRLTLPISHPIPEPN